VSQIYNSEKIADLIRDTAKNKNIVIKTMLLDCGLGSNAISNLRHGKFIASDSLAKIADYLDVSVDLLLGRNTTHCDEDESKLLKAYRKLEAVQKGKLLERAETLAELSDDEAERIKLRQKKKSLKLPSPPQEVIEAIDSADFSTFEVVGLYIQEFDLPVSAGTGSDIENIQSEPIFVEPSDDVKKADFVLRISGDSMEPLYYDGDRVFVENADVLDIGEIGIFIYKGESFIKKYIDGELISLNQKYPPIKITEPDSFFFKGRVLGKVEVIK